LKNAINIAVVDNHVLFRKGIISLVRECKDISILFEANNGKELLEKLKTEKPDIILLDIEMPEMDGIEATTIIKKKYPDLKIIMLTMHDDCSLIHDLLQRGANGYLTKDAVPEQVIEALYTVFEKGYYLDEKALKALTQRMGDDTNYKSTFSTPTLSKREIEVVRLICDQYTIKEIAGKLNISPRTVDTYRENIYSKTCSKNIAGVVMYAIKNNLVS
jgi:DNA-binding NarL/FixJ family response regulator